MKALTISQPFASLIADGQKFVENRRWFTPYRGPLAIHAGKGTQYLDRDELKDYPTGCVIATVRIVACLKLSRILVDGYSQEVLSGTGVSLDDVLKHEHTEGPFCWVLTDVERLSDPIPFRGAQGLWGLPEPSQVGSD